MLDGRQTKGHDCHTCPGFSKKGHAVLIRWKLKRLRMEFGDVGPEGHSLEACQRHVRWSVYCIGLINSPVLYS